jgi:hypothetical protein
LRGRCRIGQLQRRFDDQAERTLGSDDEMTQVVAGGILRQAAIEIEQVALRRHKLQSGDPFARVAVTDHTDSAGVGRDVAADRARTARAEIHRVYQSALTRRLLHRFKDDAGLHRQRAIHCVEGEHLVHALEADDQFA